jgi:hypothetical protein
MFDLLMADVAVSSNGQFTTEQLDRSNIGIRLKRLSDALPPAEAFEILHNGARDQPPGPQNEVIR